MITVLLEQIIQLLKGWIEKFNDHAEAVEDSLTDLNNTASDIELNTDPIPDIRDNTGAIITPITQIKTNTDSIKTDITQIKTDTVIIKNNANSIATSAGAASAFAEDCATNTLDIKDKVTTIASDTTQIRADHAELENDLDKIYNAIKWSCLDIETTETESGASPLSFNTDKAAALILLLVNDFATQSGSGDPSPDNIRPITPAASIDIVVNGNSITISFGTNIAEGVIDVITGKLTITHYYGEITAAQNKNESGGGYFWYTSLNQLSFPAIYALNSEAFSNRFKMTNNTTVTDLDGNMTLYANGIVRWKEQSSLNITDYNTYLSSNPIQICYKLATPIEVSLTPEVINSIVGDNVISSNANGDITVTYKESVKHYLDKQDN